MDPHPTSPPESSPPTRSGDRNEIHLGDNAQAEQIAAGSNINQRKIQTQTYIESLTLNQKISNLPWKWIFVVLAALVGLSVITLLIYRGVNSINQTLNPDPCPMPAGQFNVGIADFVQLDERGQPQPWSWNEGIKNALDKDIKTSLAANPNSNRDVVAYAKGIEAVTDAAVLNQVITRCNPAILVYGTVTKKSAATLFTPKFWVQDIQNAGELVGDQLLGAALPIDDSRAYDPAANRELSARLRALVLFVHGLSQFEQKQYRYAAEDFQAATQIDDWTNGKEVAFVFYGTALKERNDAGDIQAARAAYTNALTINPDYARAYIGLGNLAYAEFQADTKTNDKLNEAVQDYQIAKTKAPTVAVRARAGMNLSLMYYVGFRRGQADDSVRAENELNEIKSMYNNGATELRGVMPEIYGRLGDIYASRTPPDKVRAHDNYAKCAELAEDTSKFKKDCMVKAGQMQ